MNLFALNIALAFAWAALTGTFTLPSLIIGYTLGFLSLWLAQPLATEPSPYFKRTFRLLRLAGFFLAELMISSLRVTWDILTPTHRSSPQIIEVPLTVEGEFGILLATNLISLTPGTLSLDVTPDRKHLVVHAMFAEDPDAVREDLERFMRLVREALE